MFTLRIGQSPRPRPLVTQNDLALEARGYLPAGHKEQVPGWQWEGCRDRLTGKTAAGWTKLTAETPDKETLKVFLQVHYHNLEMVDFKAEFKMGPPPIVVPVPYSWYEFGTRRLYAEWLAGVRPWGFVGRLEDLPGYRGEPQPIPQRTVWRRGRR